MSQPTAILDALNIDPENEIPLYRQIYDGLRNGILSSQLVPGTRLPPSRTLARELRVGRNTVVAAYEQLMAEGYLDSRVGAGTHVSEIPPDSLLEVGIEERVAKDKTPARNLSKRGVTLSALKRSSPFFEKGAAPAFHSGLPSLELFPHQIWARLLSRRARQPQSRLFDYQLGAGFPALRIAISTYLGAARGVNCGPENIIVTTGAQGALDLATRMVLDPGDTVWMEDPGYLGARGAFQGADANIIPVPIDEEGMNPKLMPAGTPDPRLIYLTPSHQYPLGVTMSLTRRLSMLKFAHRTGSWILEDDYDSEFRFSGRPLSSLQGMDQSGSVLYMGTLAKTLFPALRIGYLVVPDHLSESFERALRITGQNPPAIVQATLADFMDEGHFTAHIRRMRSIYAERQQILLEGLDQHLKGYLTPTRPEGGMQLAAFLPKHMSDVKLSAYLRKHNMYAGALSPYFMGENTQPGLYVGFAGVPEQKIRSGTERLAALLDAYKE